MAYYLTSLTRRRIIASQPAKRTKSGSIVSFWTNIARPMKVVAEIVPVQDLHGYDAPYPGGGGKNKLNPELVELGAYTNDGEKTANGDNKYRRFETTLSTGTWTFSTSLASCRILRVLVNNELVASNIDNSYCSFTLTESASVKICWRKQDSTSITETLNNQIEEGSSATSYAPYSNICPISGHTGCNVASTGKNLFDPVSANFKTGYYLFTNDTEQSNAKYKYTQSYFRVKPSTNYVMSYDKEMTDAIGCYVNLYDENKQYVSRISISGMTGTGHVSGSFTTTATTAYARFSMPYRSSDGGETGIQLEENSEATTYESFGTTLPVTWQSIAGTVYGGDLTLNKDGTGVVVSRLKYKTFTADDIWVAYRNDIPGVFYYLLSDSDQTASATPNIYCDTYKPRETGAGTASRNNCEMWLQGMAIYPRLYVKDTAFADDTECKNGMVGVSVAYPLATPVAYPLTAEQVGGILSSLKGTNNVFCDTGDTAVDYWGF